MSSRNKKLRQQDAMKPAREKTEERNRDDSDNDEPMEEEIEVEFEAQTMNPDDLSGVQCLLRQLFQQDDIAHGLSELLLQQNQVGSVIKQSEIPEESDDEGATDVFGVMSVVNITEKKDVPCIKILREYLLTKCKTSGDNSKYTTLRKLLDDTENHVGFIICERFVNIPSQISVPMYESLRSDLEAANSRNQPFKFANYILISKTYCSGPSKSAKSVLYANREEECFLDDSLLQFEFEAADVTALAGKWDDDSAELHPQRKVSVFSRAKFENITNKIKPLFEN